jgi:proteasome lid subunit RPN8/RPN11
MAGAPTLRVPRALWTATWSGLRSRADGVREAACVWAGDRESDAWIVRSVHFLEDFGPVSAGPLHHRASRVCVEHLFDEMRRRGESLVADVHVHPDEWVDLSPTDEAHPIEYRIGLLAIVLPHFAAQRPGVAGIGVHEYMATSSWRRLPTDEVTARLHVE